jgi:hypothetical protein
MPPPSDDEDTNDDEAELLASAAEKEAELIRTQELINERTRQVEAAVAELHRINEILRQFENLAHSDVNSKNETSHLS